MKSCVTGGEGGVRGSSCERSKAGEVTPGLIGSGWSLRRAGSILLGEVSAVWTHCIDLAWEPRVHADLLE